LLGVPEDALLVGVVARMQPHRRFDLLLGALARLLPAIPSLRLVVIGRGTHAEAVVRAPARAMGLEQRVVFAGYRTQDYADVLGAMDLMSFLVPGSDGTCRALLEGAALGLPLVGTRRGAIPEIISNGQTGLLVDEDEGALAAAWAELLEDPIRRREMGEAARRDAHDRFLPDRFAARMERFYEEVLARG
jgi:glycosyltransferase involved in cell wall biosynthesis